MLTPSCFPEWCALPPPIVLQFVAPHAPHLKSEHQIHSILRPNIEVLYWVLISHCCRLYFSRLNHGEDCPGRKSSSLLPTQIGRFAYDQMNYSFRSPLERQRSYRYRCCDGAYTRLRVFLHKSLSVSVSFSSDLGVRSAFCGL